MPRSYEEHLAAALKHHEQLQKSGLLKTSGKFQGIPQDPHYPWRGHPSWEEYNTWKMETAAPRGD
jgi:hypothetical protein